MKTWVGRLRAHVLIAIAFFFFGCSRNDPPPKPVETATLVAASTSSPNCSAAGDPTVGVDLGFNCTGALAAATFTHALCACDAIQDSNSLSTDGFDSSVGGPTGGLGGDVAANTSVSWSTTSNIGGTLWTPGNVSSSNPSTVRGDLHLGGTLSGSGTFTVSGNAFVVKTLPTFAHVLGKATKVTSVATPCSCSSPLPVASITVAHRAPNNDDAVIGLSPTAYVGNNPAHLDLPCGNYYLTQINAAQPLTIAVHGHTALYVDGNIQASQSLIFQVDSGATFDLFVAGTFSAAQSLMLGSTARPESCRVFVAGTNFVTSGNATWGCNVYAPNALITLANNATVYGSIFAKNVQVSGNAIVHYDSSILRAGAECCSSTACDDANPCTADSCNADGTCQHATLSDGVACSGTNKCFQSYACHGGTCTAAAPVVCSAMDQCHAAGTCNAATGTCSNPTQPDGTACNDGNACTQTDKCQAGTCGGTNPITCAALDQCHVAGTCNPTTGACSAPTKPDGTVCNDGNPCTQTDTCQGGACTGANLVLCSSLDQCHAAGVCDTATGLCSNPTKPNGTACSDGNACTQTDICENGACAGGNTVVCATPDQCHSAGVCDTRSGTCSNPPKANGTACNDGNACTQTDTCQSGACTGASPIVCSAIDQCHLAGACDATSGTCSNPIKTNGTSCSDGNVCNGAESCNNGTCASGPAPVVDDGNPCTADACDPIAGVSHTLLSSGTSCSDGNACNGAEMCNGSGNCSAGIPVQVDDGNACTVDSCDPIAGVSHSAAPAGMSCSDGNACNGSETCNGMGGCAPGSAPVLDDGNPCTMDSCDPSTGVSHVATASGTSCGAQMVCNDSGQCVSLQGCTDAASSDDHNPCTADSCSGGVAVHTPMAAGSLCAPSSYCDASGACVPVIPPDPATIAPAVDKTVATSLYARTVFLTQGAHPIQTGVVQGAIEAAHAACLRGRAVDRTQNPLSDVAVEVLFHPELGGTLTRNDGHFDLLVNGGGDLIVTYNRQGYLPVHRRVTTPWNDCTTLDDVVMIPLDPTSSAVQFDSSSVQVAAGSETTDANGTRRPLLLFQPNTTAEMVFDDGTTSPLSGSVVHLTEYTEGPLGPKTMPAGLPATSGYTYAVEFTSEEAEAAHAQTLRFSQPAALYVDDFIGFPIGSIVPHGVYDRKIGCWKAEGNGVVLSVLSVDNGIASLDVDGTGSPASMTTLASLGVSDAELQEVALLYPPGVHLWRVPVQHFTQPADCNFPIQPFDPPPTTDPDPPTDSQDDQDSDLECGSVIEATNQVLGESVKIAGTSLQLNYRSARVPGRKDKWQIEIPVSGPQVGPATLRFDVEVEVAGQLFQQSFPATPSQNYLFEWNGLDVYGRQLTGAQPAVVRVGRVVSTRYEIAKNPSAFAEYGDPSKLIGQLANPDEFTLWKSYNLKVGDVGPEGQSIAGWTLAGHNEYDFGSRTLFMGDGSRRHAETSGTVFERYAGVPFAGSDTNDGKQALSAHFDTPIPLVVAPSGDVYVGERFGVERIDHNTGIVNAFMGHYSCSDPADGVQAKDVCPSQVLSLAMACDGSVIVADRGPFANGAIYRIDTQGILHTLAGRCFGSGCTSVNDCTFDGDGGPAAQAEMCNPEDIAVGSDCAIYTFEFTKTNQFSGFGRVRKISPDGLIHSIAEVESVDEDSASYLEVAVAPDGAVLYTDPLHQTIRRITPDGNNAVFAGQFVPLPPPDQATGQAGYAGDGGPALDARLDFPRDLAFAPDGTLIFSDFANCVLRKITPNSIITTIAGPNIGCKADIPFRSVPISGIPAGQVSLAPSTGNFEHFNLAPDGNVYMVFDDRTIIRSRSAFPGGVLSGGVLVPSADGSEVYRFDQNGRHLQTLHPLTGSVLETYGYDGAGRLASVTDAFDNVTAFNRGADGTSQTIVGPYGHVTTLETDQNGWLSKVRDPAGAEISFTYTPDGLMTSMTDAGGGVHNFDWDVGGRLIRDENPAGGVKTFDRVATLTSTTVTRTSAEGVVLTYGLEALSTGQLRRVITNAASSQSVTTFDPSAQTYSVQRFDGTTTASTLGPSAQWGMLAPLISQSSTTTPAGLSEVTSDTESATLVSTTNPTVVQSATNTLTINGKSRPIAFDGTARQQTYSSPLGRVITVTMDTLGRPTVIAPPASAPVALSYDSRGRLTAISRNGLTSSTTYDASGNPQTYTNAAQETQSFVHDAVGRITSVTRADGTTVGIGYDTRGNITSVVPPGGQVHMLAYTPTSHLETYTPPDTGSGANVTAYAYDKDGRLIVVSRPDGTTVSLSYDAAGRLQSTTLPTGTIALGYSPTSGKLISINGPYGINVAQSYDGALNIGSAWTGSVTGSVTRTFDSSFRLASETVNGGNTVSFSYDSDSLLTGVGGLSLAYDAASSELTTAALGVVSDSRIYDAFGRVKTYTAESGSTMLYSATYGRDALGRISQTTEAIQGATTVTAYTYDHVGRLASVTLNGATIRSYVYDVNGNRTSVTSGASESIAGAYDLQDRLTTYGSMTYSFAPGGELQSKLDTATAQRTTYSFDALGNLTRVVLADGRAIDYLIDGAHRRVGKKINGTLVKTWLYADQLRPVAELDASGTVISRFVYGTRGNVPEYMIRGGVAYRFITDQEGSLRLVVDSTNGSVVERIDRDEFGNVSSDSNPGFQPFGFAGGLYDSDTGLVRLGARDYDPVTGRWVIRDPVLFRGGQTNLYVYVGSDPVNASDPLGLYTYDQQATQSILDAALAGYSDQSSTTTALITALYNNSSVPWGPTGSYDFKYITAEDYFDVPGVGVLDAGDFGNYFAGYVNMGAFGPAGILATRAGGQIDSLLEYKTLDDPYDQDLITRGLYDYLATHGRRWGRDPNLSSNESISSYEVTCGR